MLTSNDKKIILRPIIESDIEDYVIWNTIDIEWQNWDAPWEKEDESEETIRKNLTNFCLRVKENGINKLRPRFELCLSNDTKTHIGWVTTYSINNDYIYQRDSKFCAVGIDIPSKKYRGKGYGTSALNTLIQFLKEQGITQIYTQTWSGNIPMINLANKLGFKECNRNIGFRLINNKLYDGLTFVYANQQKHKRFKHLF